MAALAAAALVAAAPVASAPIISAAEISAAFRALPSPVIGRINDGAFIMDLRCLEPGHEQEFMEQLKRLDLSRVSS